MRLFRSFLNAILHLKRLNSARNGRMSVLIHSFDNFAIARVHSPSAKVHFALPIDDMDLVPFDGVEVAVVVG